MDRKGINNAGRYDDKWVLETKDATISLEDTAYVYLGLMFIERCFRSLKRTQIKMMPMYHWLPNRNKSQVRICVLTLLIERLTEITCGKPWSRIRTTLQKNQATEFVTPSQHFYQLNELSKGAELVLKQLAITWPHKVFGIQDVKKYAPITSTHAKIATLRQAAMRLALSRGADFKPKTPA